MIDSLQSDLPWLPGPPADLRARCAALQESHDLKRDLQRLAQTRLNANQLVRLAKSLAAFSADDVRRAEEWLGHPGR